MRVEYLENSTYCFIQLCVYVHVNIIVNNEKPVFFNVQVQVQLTQ